MKWIAVWVGFSFSFPSPLISDSAQIISVNPAVSLTVQCLGLSEAQVNRSKRLWDPQGGSLLLCFKVQEAVQQPVVPTTPLWFHHLGSYYRSFIMSSVTFVHVDPYHFLLDACTFSEHNCVHCCLLQLCNHRVQATSIKRIFLLFTSPILKLRGISLCSLSKSQVSHMKALTECSFIVSLRTDRHTSQTLVSDERFRSH